MIVDGMGGTEGFGPGQEANAASSCRSMSCLENAPDTAAIMLAGWTQRRWKARRSSRVIERTEASVASRLLKCCSP